MIFASVVRNGESTTMRDNIKQSPPLLKDSAAFMTT